MFNRKEFRTIDKKSEELYKKLHKTCGGYNLLIVNMAVANLLADSLQSGHTPVEDVFALSEDFAEKYAERNSTHICDDCKTKLN
jgi:hypothetical protein